MLLLVSLFLLLSCVKCDRIKEGKHSRKNSLNSYFEANNITLVKHYNRKYNFFYLTCDKSRGEVCKGPHDFPDSEGLMMHVETDFAVSRMNEAKAKQNGVCNVVDVGANFGYFTLLALSLGCKVYAFEPDLKNFNLLLLNFQLNDYSNYVAYNMPAGVSGSVPFDGWSAANPTTQNEAKQMKTMPVSDVLTRGTTQIDWFKLDVEGFEDNVIQSVPADLVVKSFSVEITYYLYKVLNYDAIHAFLDKRFAKRVSVERNENIVGPSATYTNHLHATQCNKKVINYCQYNVFAWN